jgi:hypothetical protein
MEDDINTQLMQAMLAAPLHLKKSALKLLRQEKAPPTGPEFMTGVQGAHMLGVSRTTFRRWMREAGLKRVQILPGRFRYRREEIEALARNAGVAS